MASQSVTEQMTDGDSERHAFKLLAQELGLGGLARFIRLHRSGPGNYTADRQTRHDDLTIDEVLATMKHPISPPNSVDEAARRT